MTVKTKGPPETVEQLYAQWGGRLAKTVRSFGFTEDEVPDIIQELLTRFIEGKNGKDYLKYYQPEKGAFSTYMYTFVLTRLRGWRARRDFRAGKELPLVTGYPTGDGDAMPMELIDQSSWKSFADVESSRNIALITTQLRSLGAEGATFATLIEDMVEQLESPEGKIDRRKLAAKQHISLAELRRRLHRMSELQLIKDWHD